MARAAKLGLDYFPIDTDMDQDDKMCFIEAQHPNGFAIIVKLLMAIYREGYYKEWSEQAETAFSGRKGITQGELSAVVASALEIGFFSREMYDSYQILTSSGIQRRYIGGAQRRDRICIDTRYSLVSRDEFPDAVANRVIFSTEIQRPTPRKGINATYRPRDSNATSTQRQPGVDKSAYREGGSIGREDREGVGGEGTAAPSPPPAASAVSRPAGQPADAQKDDNASQPLDPPQSTSQADADRIADTVADQLGPPVMDFSALPPQLRAATERARLKVASDAKAKAEHSAQKTSDYHAVTQPARNPYAPKSPAAPATPGDPPPERAPPERAASSESVPEDGFDYFPEVDA